MTNFRSVLLFFTPCLILSCSTPPPEKPKKILLPISQSSYSSWDRQAERYNDIDVNGLLQELAMDQPINNLGFQEKSFNTCSIESNRSKSPHCQRLYVSRLNFQVVCRDSTGTVERVNLTPLTSDRLRWKKQGGKRGLASTDNDGFGRLGFITKRPSEHGYIYFYLGSKIARKRFKDNWKVVLPKNWCQH